ncbi:MAG: RNA polymerase sigma factor [Alphaproteobacteria bacterium]|nr:RNA polymerase sigma factor [Alphaproteobacteria bacterium]
MDGAGGVEFDETLVRRVASGSAPAFEVLIRRHMRRTIALAQGISGNAGDADEIAQEAFMRVWQHAGRWDPDKGQFTTWLYRIVVNLCLDRRRRPQWLPMETAGDVADLREDAPAVIARKEHQRAVAKAMESIPARQRAAVSLFYFQELSGREAAEVMGIKPAAFEQLLFRARRAIKAELMARGVISADGVISDGVEP